MDEQRRGSIVDKILKYKKASNIFRITLILGAISLGAYHIISLINSKEFFGHAMISTILFYSFVVVALIFMTIFDIKRYKLLDEVFGKVDDADKEIAKNLLCRIKEVGIGEFSFLNYEDADVWASAIEALCRQDKKVYPPFQYPADKGGWNDFFALINKLKIQN